MNQFWHRRHCGTHCGLNVKPFELGHQANPPENRFV
jgi:hypothetical protein